LTIGPDSSLRKFPLLYLYFDTFDEISKAWKQGNLEAALHDSDYRCKDYSLDEVMVNEELFLNLYESDLIRLKQDSVTVFRDVERRLIDRITQPEKYSGGPGDITDPEFIKSYEENRKVVDELIEAIKIRYGDVISEKGFSSTIC